MTEDFTTISLRYLLDELDPPERAAFELRLEREPAAAAAFKTCADSLGRFGLERGSVESLSSEDLQLGWAELQSRVAEEAFPPGRGNWSRGSWRRYFWPMAAAVLLGLNLWQWTKPERVHWKESAATATAAAPAVRRAEASRPIKSEPGVIAAQLPNGPGAPGKGGTDPRVALELRRLETLRQQFQALQKDRDALAKEYGQIVNQLIPAVTVETGAGRLVAMELVDEASYNSGDRNGLLAKAKALLTTPGIVAVPNSTAPTGAGSGPGPVQESAPVAADPTVPVTLASTGTTTPASVAVNGNTVTIDGVTVSLSGNSLTVNGTSSVTDGATAALNSVATGPITLNTSLADNSTGSLTISNAPTTSVPTTPADPTTPVDATTPPPAAPSAPYAWSVYDDTAHQGYVNLYNLPTVSSDTVLELWIQPAGSTQFQPVGQVPSQFYGQSGSLYYQLPPTTPTPSQILITVEPSNSNLTTPSGKTVLRGP